MSTIIRPSQFYGPGVRPIDRTEQAKMDLALRLALSVMLPKPPSPYRGADAYDCDRAIEAIESVCSMCVDFVQQVVKNVHENTPVDQTRGFDDAIRSFLACMEDGKNDVVGSLQQAADKMVGA